MTNNFDLKQSPKFERNYWLISCALFSIILSMVLFGGVSGQLEISYDFTPQYEVLGLQYRFENGWADQFSGKIYTHNETALTVEWYKYDDTTPLKNITFHNPNADHYDLELFLSISNDTTKTFGVFYVTWLDNRDKILGSEQDEGALIIRDNLRIKRFASEIIKIRKYQYQVGELD